MLGKKDPRTFVDFKAGQQQDAHEFLLVLLESLYSTVSPPPPIFDGILCQKTQCLECRYISQVDECFRDIRVNVPVCNGTMETIIKNLSTSEIVDNFKCKNCNKYVKVNQAQVFKTFPKFLIIQIRRFSETGSKIKKQFQCLETIKLLDDSQKLHTFKFVSSIEHIGLTMSSGHYITISKISDTEFYKFDDSRVSHVSTTSLIKSDVYVAIYKKLDIMKTSSVSCNLSKNEVNNSRNLQIHMQNQVYCIISFKLLYIISDIIKY